MGERQREGEREGRGGVKREREEGELKLATLVISELLNATVSLLHSTESGEQSPI